MPTGSERTKPSPAPRPKNNKGPAGTADGALVRVAIYETVTLIFMPSALCGTQ
jgi:hypothetical protein